MCISRLGMSPAPWEQLAVIDALSVFLQRSKPNQALSCRSTTPEQNDAGSSCHACLRCMGSSQYAGHLGERSLLAEYLFSVMLVHLKYVQKQSLVQNNWKTFQIKIQQVGNFLHV